MKQFNGLTPAESERLYLLAEECGEVVQAIGKILRHGYESKHPDGGSTNRQSLELELGDIDAAVKMLIRAGDLSTYHIIDASDEKAESVNQYLHHQDD